MIERRFTNSVPVSANNKNIVGLASVFYRNDDANSEFELWDNAFERMDKNCFNVESDIDCIACFNHDDDKIMGRKSNNNLRLWIDERGLNYDIIEPDQSISFVGDVFKMLKRGDLKSSSFAMLPTKVNWTEETRNGKTIDVRNILSVDLYDISVVSRPAYGSANCGLRSQNLTDIKTEFRNHKAQLQNEKRMQHIKNLKASLL